MPPTDLPTVFSTLSSLADQSATSSSALKLRNASLEKQVAQLQARVKELEERETIIIAEAERVIQVLSQNGNGSTRKKQLRKDPRKPTANAGRPNAKKDAEKDVELMCAQFAQAVIQRVTLEHNSGVDNTQHKESKTSLTNDEEDSSDNNEDADKDEMAALSAAFAQAVLNRVKGKPTAAKKDPEPKRPDARPTFFPIATSVEAEGTKTSNGKSPYNVSLSWPGKNSPKTMEVAAGRANESQSSLTLNFPQKESGAKEDGRRFTLSWPSPSSTVSSPSESGVHVGGVHIAKGEGKQLKVSLPGIGRGNGKKVDATGKGRVKQGGFGGTFATLAAAAGAAVGAKVGADGSECSEDGGGREEEEVGVKTEMPAVQLGEPSVVPILATADGGVRKEQAESAGGTPRRNSLTLSSSESPPAVKPDLTQSPHTPKANTRGAFPKTEDLNTPSRDVGQFQPTPQGSPHMTPDPGARLRRAVMTAVTASEAGRALREAIGRVMEVGAEAVQKESLHGEALAALFGGGAGGTPGGSEASREMAMSESSGEFVAANRGMRAFDLPRSSGVVYELTREEKGVYASICMMRRFRDVSVEELRLGDYFGGDRGSGGNTGWLAEKRKAFEVGGFGTGTGFGGSFFGGGFPNG